MGQVQDVGHSRIQVQKKNNSCDNWKFENGDKLGDKIIFLGMIIFL